MCYSTSQVLAQSFSSQGNQVKYRKVLVLGQIGLRKRVQIDRVC